MVHYWKGFIMKRFAILFCIVLFITALPMSHVAFAKKADKVQICHATDSKDIEANQWTLIVGHVIEVSANAVDAHLAHGDSSAINDIDDGPVIFGLTWRQVAENLGLNTAGANCAAFVLDSE